MQYGESFPGHPGIRLVREDDITTHDIQAATEGIVLEDGDSVMFLGQKFRLAERVGIMPMLNYANASKKGMDSDDMDGLAAMYALIRSVIHRPALFDENGKRQVDENGKPLRDESEWERFSTLADDESADGEQIMEFVGRAMEIMAARPTARREVSSASSPQTSPTSKPASSWPATIPQTEGLIPVADLGR